MDKRIIITGNIGSGKSTVTKILEELGYKVISADEESAKILRANQKEVSKLFNIRPMSFDSFKKELSSRVFSNSAVKKDLEDYILPIINKEVDIISTDYERRGIQFVTELPTLFETRGLKRYDDLYIVNVIADKALRVQRIMERNKHLSIQDTLDRMKAQIEPSLKEEFSSVTLDNSSNYDTLKEKVININNIFLKGIQ